MDTAGSGETDLEKVLEAAIRKGYETLAQTTDMNPVLKKAGVVDAGGKGYLLILEGMLAALRVNPCQRSPRITALRTKLILPLSLRRGHHLHV